LELINSFTINQQIYLKKTSSTNEFANKLIANSNPKQNFSIYSYNQTSGKGQIGRYWYSGVGKNLALSLVLTHNHFKVSDQFLLNIATALGVLGFLAKYLPDNTLSIKWPNDIYVGDKKIAGILIQNQLRGKQISGSIIGIGLNINETDFPIDIPNPVSLSQLLDKRLNLFQCKCELEYHMLSFLNKMHLAKKLQRSLYMNNLYRKGEKHFFEIKDKQCLAEIVDVTEVGKLVLNIEGDKHAFNFRELKFVI